MRSKSRIGGAGVAGALAVLLAAGCGGGGNGKPAGAPSAGPKPKVATGGGGFRPGKVSFGVLAPLTGDESQRGQDLVDGAKLAMTDLNIQGGVLGQKVALVTYDDGCDAKDSRRGALTLKGSDVAGAVGGICTTAASAAARALGTTKPFLVTSANAPGIVNAKQTPNAYLTNGTPYQSALAAVHWLAYLTAQRLAVITEDDKANKYLGAQVLGLSSPVPAPVSEQAVPASTTDWSSSVKAALAGKPDTVYFAGSAKNAGGLLAALRQAGYDGKFIASEQSDNSQFIAAAGEAAEGAYVIAPATPQNLPKAASWATRFELEFKHPPGLDAFQAYDAVRALAQAVTQSGKVDAKRNSQEVGLISGDFSTFLGTGFSFARDHTIKYDNNIALVVKGGRFKVANTLRSEGQG